MAGSRRRTDCNHAAAFAESELQPQFQLAVPRHERRQRRGVKRLRRAGFVEQRIAQPQRQVGFLEGDARIARRGNDAAPVGVGAEQGGFHQGAVGDRLGDLPRLGVGARAGHIDAHQVRRALGVGGDGAGQLPADRRQRGAELRQTVAGERRAFRLAVGQDEQRVVGAGVALDADAVEAAVAGGAQDGVKIVGRDRGVGHQEAEHRRHVRPDHRGPLGESRDPDVDPVHV